MQILLDKFLLFLDKFLLQTLLPCPKPFFHLLPVWGYCHRDIALPISAKLFSHSSDRWSMGTETFQERNLSQTNTGCCSCLRKKSSLPWILWELQGACREVLRPQRFLFLSMGSRVDALTFATIRECGTFHKLRDFRVQCLGQKLVPKSAPWVFNLFQLDWTEASEMSHPNPSYQVGV